MIETASTISRLCIFAPGLSRSRTIVVIPALYPRAAVRWTGFFWSSLGKDYMGLSATGDSEQFTILFYLDLSSVTGGPLPGKESKRTMSRGFLQPLSISYSCAVNDSRFSDEHTNFLCQTIG